MISDTDLANGKFLKPKRQPKWRKPSPGRPQKNEEKSPPRKRKKGSKLFSLISLIILILLCDFAVRGRRSFAYRQITANRNVVSAITCDNEKPFAIVCGRLAHEGDTINGYKVVKIHPNKVELLKDGKHLVETVANLSGVAGASLPHADLAKSDQPVVSLPDLSLSSGPNPNNQPTHQSIQSGELAEAARPELIESVESQPPQ
jgi:hypothetical protein